MAGTQDCPGRPQHLASAGAGAQQLLNLGRVGHRAPAPQPGHELGRLRASNDRAPFWLPTGSHIQQAVRPQQGIQGGAKTSSRLRAELRSSVQKSQDLSLQCLSGSGGSRCPRQMLPPAAEGGLTGRQGHSHGHEHCASEFWLVCGNVRLPQVTSCRCLRAHGSSVHTWNK